jgi:hypothetical protein
MAGQIRDERVRISSTTYAPLEGRERLTRLFTALLKQARRIRDPFEQSFFALAQISYLQAFVDVDKDDYMNATICLYELTETGPLAELHCWSYLRACQHYDVSAKVIGFDEIAARYRSLRRAMVAQIVKARVAPSGVRTHVRRHMPKEVSKPHREKFTEDVASELEHLDVPRMAGLGITKAQLETWLRLKRHRYR